MLEIQTLSKTYPGGVQALKSVSLSVPKGMFGLLGPNGAGKSTLMRIIATLQSPDSGRVIFDDIDVLAEPERIRRLLGYLPQDFGVYPRMSARALLDHLAVLKGLTGRKERKQIVEALLEQTNLTAVANKAVASYSGGMRQRFGIAQALIGDPKLIIVDEPTAGLDPEERNRFQNLLSEIGENVVVILSTHIVDDVADLCPQMAILNEGEIAALGAPAELTGTLAGKVWRKTIEKADLPAHQDRFRVISSQLVAGKPVIHIHAGSDPGDGFEAVTPTLEDFYFHTISNSKQAMAA